MINIMKLILTTLTIGLPWHTKPHKQQQLLTLIITRYPQSQ
jgi:hypothetical protein